MKRFIGCLLVLRCLGSHADPAVLTLDLSTPGRNVSPTLYGLMTEEINHSYDGGLYAELIQNRNFKESANNPVCWSTVGDATINLDDSQPINSALPVCLKLQAQADSGVANEGYWGIPIKPRTPYRVSFYARCAEPSGGALTVSLRSDDGQTVFASAKVPHIGTEWKRYSVTLKTSRHAAASVHNQFVITASRPGVYRLNLVSLFPPTWNHRPNGNRPDIMQVLADMQPGFLRFPGGNYVEGNNLAERFNFKNTLHDISQRPGKMSCWGYFSTDGMGLLEFLEWCEDLKMQPVLAVFAGYTLNHEYIQPGADLQPYVEEALQEIEYVTGGPQTTWGHQRVLDGHPAPFKLTYVEIGNEDEFDHSGSYEGRFAQFYDAIKEAHPELQLIATCPVKSRVPDVMDDHYYESFEQMQSIAHHYDHHTRTGPKIFVGEWATREGAPTPNLEGALGDAAWMTGLERNSDLIVMASYAPLFVNVNPRALQWDTDLIGYNALSVYGSPSYYAQKIFREYLGDKIVPVSEEDIPLHRWQPSPSKKHPNPASRVVPSIFYSATRNTRGGKLYLKIVNTSSDPQPVRVHLEGVHKVSSTGTLVVLASSSLRDTNTIDQPRKVVPATTRVEGISADFTRTYPPYSINILELRAD